jgi:hypothetical protein
VVSFALLQMPVDYYFWHKPFAEFMEYIRYNIANSHAYISNTWYSYTLLILGLLLPPISFLLFFGFLKSWRKNLVLFLPPFLFLVFHSWFPNKQERFILTIVPLIIVSGVAGLNEWRNAETWWSVKWLRRCFIITAILNLVLLVFVTPMYSKKARVEAMVYLGKYGKSRNIILEDTRHESVKMMPEFYLQSWIHFPEVTSIRTIDTLQLELKDTYAPDSIPDFVIFMEDYDFDKRVNDMKRVFPDLKYETTIEPGMLDVVLYKLNPKNANQELYIYRTQVRKQIGKGKTDSK